MSPAERGAAPGAATASGGGTNDGSGGHGHHDVPDAVATNTSSSPSTATAAAAAVFSGGAAAAAAVALWSKAPPPPTVTAAAQFPVEVTRQLHNIYGEHFPIEARYALTGWLDASFNEELESGNPQHEEHARALVMTMVQQLEGKAASETDFTSKGRLEQVIENIKVGNPKNSFAMVSMRETSFRICSYTHEAFVKKFSDSLVATLLATLLATLDRNRRIDRFFTL